MNNSTDKIIEACAEALKKQHKFNPAQVKCKMELFGMDMFGNTPTVIGAKKHWHYLRDGESHAAIVFNVKTNKIIFIEKKRYWLRSIFNEFRLSNSQIKAQINAAQTKIDKTLSSEVYKELAKVIHWALDCPIHVGAAPKKLQRFTPIDCITTMLQSYPYEYSATKATKLAHELFEAYHEAEKEVPSE